MSHPMISGALERLDQSSLDKYDRRLILSYVERLEAAVSRAGRVLTRIADDAVIDATAADEEDRIRGLDPAVVEALQAVVERDGDDATLLVDAHEDPVELLTTAGLLVFTGGDWSLTPFGRACVRLLVEER